MDGEVESKEEDFLAEPRNVLLEGFNEERTECEPLTLDLGLCQTAQTYAECLRDKIHTPVPAAGRYFVGGSSGCVVERVVMYKPTSGQKLNWDRPGDTVKAMGKRLLKSNKDLAEGFHPEYTSLGLGVCCHEKENQLYIVFAFSMQLMEFTNGSKLSIREQTTLEGKTLKDGFKPVGFTLHFFSKEEENSIPLFHKASDVEQMADEKKEAEQEKQRPPVSLPTGKLLCKIMPWELDLQDGGAFSANIDFNGALQRHGIFNPPEGIYQVRMYAQKSSDGIPYSEASVNYKFPNQVQHFSACCASIPFPPPPGSEVAEAEAAIRHDRIVRQVTTPIEHVSVVQAGGTMPQGYEVYTFKEQTAGSLPLLCFQKGETCPDSFSGKDNGAQPQEYNNPCVVEIAIAFGADDVPPGFDIVRDANDDSEVNIRSVIPHSPDSDPEENEAEIGGKEPVYLCIRKSTDPVEISARGITEVFLRHDSDDSGEEFYDKLDILPGEVHALFRLVGMGNIPEALGKLTSGGQGQQAHDDEEDEDFDPIDNHENDEWGMETKDCDHGALDPDSLRGGQLGDCVLPTAESKRVELEEAEKHAQAKRIEQLIENARLEQEQLLNESEHLQKLLVPYIAKKNQQENSTQQEDDQRNDENTSPQADASLNQEKDISYSNSLNACNDATETLNRTREAYDRVAMDLQTRLDDKEAKATEIRNSFAHFKREIAKAAENSRSGKPIPIRIIKQFEETEQQKDGEVEKVRLKNINLRSQLRKLENALHEKEKLAEGLHLIDFEQLKIENQTLNEKIEERNEELHKLRKKTTTTVQVLTHIKEKLQFVQAESLQLRAELSTLDKEVTASRDQLTKSKHARDALRTENESRKRDQGFVNSDLLVQDFQSRKREIKGLKRKIKDLQQKYVHLTGDASKADPNTRHE